MESKKISELEQYNGSASGFMVPGVADGETQKADMGAMVDQAAGAAGYLKADGLKTINGQSVAGSGDLNVAVMNPLKGTYLDTDTLPTTGQDGDYIYVVNTSVTPRTANVYAWNGTAFADTGKSVEDFGLQFASGQAVNGVAIKDLDGNNVQGETNVLSAEDGINIGQKVRDITLEEEKVVLKSSGNSQNVYGGFVDGTTGGYHTTSGNNSFVVVNVTGKKYVRFLGAIKSSNSNSLTGYSFGTITSGSKPDSTLSNFTPIEYAEFDRYGTENVRKQYILPVPSGATWFCVTNWNTVIGNDFYCYTETGETLIDLIKEQIEEPNVSLLTGGYRGEFGIASGCISGEGVFKEANVGVDRSSYIYPIKEIKEIIIAPTSGTITIKIWFLKSYPTNGNSVQMSDEMPAPVIITTDGKTLKVPSDAEYLVVGRVYGTSGAIHQVKYLYGIGGEKYYMPSNNVTGYFNLAYTVNSYGGCLIHSNNRVVTNPIVIRGKMRATCLSGWRIEKVIYYNSVGIAEAEDCNLNSVVIKGSANQLFNAGQITDDKVFDRCVLQLRKIDDSEIDSTSINSRMISISSCDNITDSVFEEGVFDSTNLFETGGITTTSVYGYFDYDEIDIALKLAEESGIYVRLIGYDSDYQNSIVLSENTPDLGNSAGTPISFNFHKGGFYNGNERIYFVVRFWKGSNTIITVQEVLDALEINEIKYRKGLIEADKELKEVEVSFGGFNNTTNYIVATDEFQSPRENSSYRIAMPGYMQLTWAAGNHGDTLDDTGRVDLTNGAVVDFSAYNSYMQLNRLLFKFRGAVREITASRVKELYDNGEIKIFVRGVADDVISRNYDSEKSVKALESNVGKQYGLRDLPMIVHISDVHGDVTRFENAYKYARYLMAHTFVNSGDNPQRGYDNGIDWVKDSDAKIQPTPLEANKYVPYINCIGNHDVWKATTQGLFDSMIAPFKDKYGYKSAANAVTDKTYYYYDLAVESPRDQTSSTMAYTNLRFIVLDIVEGMVNYGIGRWHISQTQIEWFISTLNNTPAGYRIMVVLHTPPDTLLKPSKASDKYNLHYNKDIFVGANQVEKVENAGNAGSPSGFVGYYLEGNPIIKIIDAFIERGTVSDSYTQANDDGTAISSGYTTETVNYSANFANAEAEFVAYICGHTHCDYVCYCQHADNPQLCLCVTCGTAVYGPYGNARGASSSDVPRKTIGSTQDAFNVYVIDKQTARVGIARVGSNITCEGVKRDMQWLNYKEVVNFTINGANCVAVKGQTFSEYINGENVLSTYLYDFRRQTGITLAVNSGYVTNADDTTKRLKIGGSDVSADYVIQEGDVFTI